MFMLSLSCEEMEFEYLDLTRRLEKTMWNEPIFENYLKNKFVKNRF